MNQPLASQGPGENPDAVQVRGLTSLPCDTSTSASQGLSRAPQPTLQVRDRTFTAANTPKTSISVGKSAFSVNLATWVWTTRIQENRDYSHASVYNLSVPVGKERGTGRSQVVCEP